MSSFELVVVGSGGGPLETNLSCYLFKEYDSDWDKGIIALEAGSGLGALSVLLKDNPDLLGDLGRASKSSVGAANVFDRVHSFLITHAHLDHVGSLVLSAGSYKGPRKKVISSQEVLEFIESVFQDKVWPKLATWNPHDPPFNYLLSSIEVGERYHKITTNISVRAMPLSHGTTVSLQPYQSLAFFVRHNVTKREFLFFGDVEPDSHSQKATTKAVFRAAAPLIVAKQLNTIFLECSYPIGRSDDLLFGHLSPIHFVDELRSLAQEVSELKAIAHSAQSTEPRSNSQPPQKRRRSLAPDSVACEDSLEGVCVYVIHCKEPMEEMDDPRPIAQFIVAQINCLLEEFNLGVRVMAAEQGMRILI
ncbi:cyclic-AMP phosphodiesterase [Sistotremastrum niveocremeum HHB9708]|uniref:Cyclic-AMP phosphodiesterase n=2 Tax=Sistotremastraceae TaxID=3402574 RepID=A0A165AFX5_9AGAM|nr:cyclic-AMP phosphodiesterase [Sistotremastrum niveocremeum HHB9708]KZT44178.1 cyclic-AMP phosphodiesterase [Sistotremastrum suecicum HHB10207 ss-3]